MKNTEEMYRDYYEPFNDALVQDVKLLVNQIDNRINHLRNEKGGLIDTHANAKVSLELAMVQKRLIEIISK